MKDINEILTDFRDAIAGSYDINEQVVADIEFSFLPGAQWRGADYDQFRNRPKPENNKLARQINRILGQYQRLEMMPQIMSASDDATDDDAEILQSRWRNDFNSSDGIEALYNAADEAFTGGFGAFKVVANYEDEEVADERYQKLGLEPIYSAASSVVFNAGALRKDKADAKQGWHVVRVNRKEAEEEFGVSLASFPEAVSDIDCFDWTCNTNKDVFVAHYYEVVEKKITEYNFGALIVTRDGRKLTDNFGNKFERDEFELLKESTPYEEKRKKIKYVEYALIHGNGFLTKPVKQPFKRVPIIPQYGYHKAIRGVEFYCGEVMRQKDNQRFLNMGFGAMMEIMAQPQTQTPEYAPEQINRHAQSHANHTVENYAYLQSDPLRNPDGSIAQIGPVHIHQPPQIGTGLAASLEFLNNNIAEQGGTGQSTLPANASAEAVKEVNGREDDSYQPLFQNAMQSLKAACECWIPAAQQIYFSNERSLRVQSPDGSYSQVMTMQYELRPDIGFGPFKNSAMGRYDVTVKIDESHKTKKQAERSDNLEILQYTDTATPKGQMVLNNVILSTPGEGTQDVRRIARFENIQIMLSMGIDPQPKTDEEKAYVEQLIQQQAQQANNPQADAAQQALIAQASADAEARIMEGQAAIMNEENDRIKLSIDKQKADNDTAKVQIQAAEAGVKIDKTIAETNKLQIDSAMQISQAR